MPHHLYIRFVRLPLLLRILVITSLLIGLFGLIIHLLEPENFPTIIDGIWWAVITASTVGYGDYVPLSIPGRLTGVLLLLVGAGFLSTYFATLSSIAVTKQDEYQKGETHYKGQEQYIIIGWNERSKEIIKALSKTKESVILIDESLPTNPLPGHHVHFIKGRALRDDILLKANIREAKKVIITADQKLDELQADMNSVLTLLAIKGLNPDVLCIVEILTNEQLNNAKRAGADEIIKTNELTSAIILDSIHSTGMVNPLTDLLSELREGKQLEYLEACGETIGKSIRQATLYYLGKEVILIGIKKGEDIYVHPNPNQTIEKDDLLLVISN
ncbi:NAD-binding protein [Mesobacillus maritimus]|uniref:potassium channel family protein n=1 Tax=Mesobacillus maritimus TaxID=1643336 RepID=UPI002041890C|nr:potassium channel protein [Mesobacillus maritimus]MCM3588439.1 NAD-binding protein [Mesobacillus maritimus]